MKVHNSNRTAELLRQARLGDRNAFSEIVRMMMNPIVALTYRMTRDRDTALDLAQDTFVAAWQNLSEFKGEAKIESWLYRIAANKTLNHLKREGRNVGDTRIDREFASADPERDLQKKELRHRVLSFTDQLPPQQRLVFELRFYKQLSFDEVADHTGKALGTVKTLYREAVKKLRQMAIAEGWNE